LNIYCNFTVFIIPSAAPSPNPTPQEPLNWMSSLFRNVQLPSTTNSCGSTTPALSTKSGPSEKNPMIQSLWISRKSMFGDPAITSKYSIQDILDIMCGKLSPPQEFYDVGQFHSAPSSAAGSSKCPSKVLKNKPVKRRLFPISPMSSVDSNSSSYFPVIHPNDDFIRDNLLSVTDGVEEEDPFKIPIGPPKKRKLAPPLLPWSYSSNKSVSSYTTTTTHSGEQSVLNGHTDLATAVESTFHEVSTSYVTDFDPLATIQPISDHYVFQNQQNQQYSPKPCLAILPNDLASPSPDMFSGCSSQISFPGRNYDGFSSTYQNTESASVFNGAADEISSYHFGSNNDIGSHSRQYKNLPINGRHYASEIRDWDHIIDSASQPSTSSISDSVAFSSQTPTYESKWNKYSVEFSF